MATCLEIQKINNSFCRVLSDENFIHEELYEKFKVQLEGANQYSRHTHDRFYDKSSGKLPLGLLIDLLQHCKPYQVTLDNSLKNMIRDVDTDEIDEWISTIKLPFELYHYQRKIIMDVIKFRRLVALADTGAGKSAVIYCITRFLVEESVALDNDNKILILIPNISLRSQIINDFLDYGWGEARSWCQEILPSQSKYSNKKVVISTWQSLQNMDSEYFEQFTSVLVDEAHGASAKEMYKILKNCVNAKDRIGLTGTLSGSEHHRVKVQSMLGPVKRYVETKELQDLGQASKTIVRMINVRYPKKDEDTIKTLDYMAQVDFLHMHEHRMDTICKMAAELSKSENILLIFEKVEKGLERYEQHLIKLGVGDKVRVTTGAVKVSVRDEIKKELEENAGHIYLATWGTLSTGVNIKNLHSLFLCSSSKGLIRVLQTVGRLLRVHPSKNVAKIFDFTDNFETFIRHAKIRFQHYTSKSHPVSMSSLEIKNSFQDEELLETLISESNYRKEAKRLRDGE